MAKSKLESRENQSSRKNIVYILESWSDSTWLEDTSSVPLDCVPGLLMMWAMNCSFDQNAQSQHIHKLFFCCNF